jgi:endonuclease/exonuclease/phosphatase (EEP) superfamily protein YafD
MRLRWLLCGLLVTGLLVPAALLTAARGLDLRAGGWVRLVSFTPFATVLYLLAAVLLVPACVWGRGAWRRGSRVVASLAVLGVAVHAFWAGGPYLGASSAEAATPHRLHVMTANLLHGEADPARVVEVATANDVDVLVLLEITPQALSRLEGAGLAQAFEHRAGRAQAGPEGTMVFSRLRLTQVRRLATGFGGYAMRVRAPGGPLALLAVHPRPPLGDASKWRADQGVVRHAARAAGDRAMIAGDLNATMDHVPMRALGSSGYADAATAAHSRWQPTWPASGQVSRFGVALPSLVPIDHVLLRDGLHAVHTESVEIEGTDHRALVAVVGL